MARFLRDFGDRDLTLIGYSLGSQVLLAAFSNPCMTDFPQGRGYQLNLIATAIDCRFHALISCQPCTTALVDQTNVFHNDRDRVVALSQRICKKTQGKCADSLAVIVQRGLVPLGHVCTYNISNEVGKRHSVVRYTESATVRDVIIDSVAQR